VSYKVPPAGLILSLYHKYTGATPYFEIADVGGVETVSLAKISSYDWVDFSVQKDLFKNFTLTTGVRNLFDVVNVNNTSVDGGVHISGGSRPIGYGRSYFLGISYSINNYN
jgi:outer membrane receptor for ferrienterochelin and colicins